MATGPADPADLNLLSGLAPQLASAFVSLASDIALVVGIDGVIQNVALGAGGSGLATAAWVGRPWAETVTGPTRRKVELLLQEAGSGGVPRRREVNHPSSGGADIPMSYAALRLGAQGPVIAVGRDLRAVATIQQRFIDAQQEMERDYWKLRQAETRHRLLAQVASDAVMVVDAATLTVLQANAAARDLFGVGAGSLPGPIEELLTMARSTGRAAEVRTRLAPPDRRARLPAGDATDQIELSATPFRASGRTSQSGEAGMRLLVRARRTMVDGTAADGEAVVVTDSSGRVLMANAAFHVLCRGQPGEMQVQGAALTDLLGDPQRNLAALLAEVRKAGLAFASAALLGGGNAETFEVEAAAALMTDGDQECIGLTLRRHTGAGSAALPAALRSLVERVGSLPLTELLQQAVELTERHAIEAALRRAADDVRGAAKLLGLDDADLAQRLVRLGLSAAE